MRAGERDVLLFVLAISAGSADAWSYLGLGHAFVANMTGNTVLLGIAVFQSHGDMLHPLIALICYVAGAAMASFLTRKAGSAPVWTKTVSRALLLEGVLMAGAEVGWVAIHFRTTSRTVAALEVHPDLILAFMAFAIGLQSGAILQLKIPGIVTTYITGTWTNLTNGLVRFATSGRPRVSPQKHQFEERLLLQAGVVAVYFLSAALAGWLFRYMPLGAGVLPAGSVLFAAVYSERRTRRAGEERIRSI